MSRARGYLYLLLLLTYHTTLSGQLPPERGEDCGEEYNQCFTDCVNNCVLAYNTREIDISLGFGFLIANCQEDGTGPRIDDFPWDTEGYWHPGRGCDDGAFSYLHNQSTASVNNYFHCVENFCGQLCYYRDIYIYSCPD
jgi:hypothetical protein